MSDRAILNTVKYSTILLTSSVIDLIPSFCCLQNKSIYSISRSKFSKIIELAYRDDIESEVIGVMGVSYHLASVSEEVGYLGDVGD